MPATGKRTLLISRGWIQAGIIVPVLIAGNARKVIISSVSGQTWRQD